MSSIATVQALAQRSTVCLCRPASAIAVSRTLLRAPNTSPVLRTIPASTPLRCFSQTAAVNKKGGNAKKDKKGGGGKSKDKDVEEDDGGKPAVDVEEAFKFTEVEAAWDESDAQHAEKFKELKRSLASGGGMSDGDGGVDVDVIGKVPVSEKGQPTVPLGQLALVIPRSGGRVVELRMHSPSSRKALMSAVQSNPLFNGQQPQPDPNDELVLLIKVGSVNDKSGSSAEAIAERQRRVKDLANAWRTKIRDTTARRQKLHQQWKKDKSVVINDQQRLEKELTKGQEKRMAKIDAAEKEALKLAEKSSRR